MIHVDLSTRVTPHLHRHRFVCLRDLCGHDELSDETAVGLIDRLLVDRPGVAFGPGDATRFTLSEADSVLAAIYRSLYGDGVECHVVCAACGGAYAMSFTLTELWESVRTTSPDDDALLAGLAEADDAGVYAFRSLRFRLPTGRDVQEVANLVPEDVTRAMRARCVVEDDPSLEEAAFDRLLSLACPVLDVDLDSTCAGCGAAGRVPFNLGAFLLSALRREIPYLTREVHELARTYRWSRREILEMTRRERRQHAGLVLADLGSSAPWP